MNKNLINVLLLIFVFQARGYAFGEPDFLTGKHSFDGTVLGFRLFVPPNLNENEKYPLVLTLHGSSRRGDDNVKHVSNTGLALVWVRDSNQTKQPHFVLSPQCPYGNLWADTPWSTGNYQIDRVPISNELLTVHHLLDSLVGEYPIDTNRLYVTGLSIGGYGTWDIILRYPGKFAAAIPVCGAGDSSKAHLLSDVAVWAFHGNNDGIVPPSGSRDMMKALQNRGRDIFFTHCNWNDCGGIPSSELDKILRDKPKTIYSEYDGVGHSSYIQAYEETPQVVEWTLSQSKPITNASIKMHSHFKNTGRAFVFMPTGDNPIGIAGNTGQVLEIFDVSGKVITTLAANSSQNPWDGNNKYNRNFPAGIYLLRLK